MRHPYPDLWDSTQKAAKAPKTLGEHLKRRRLELHLLQSQLARHLGVHSGSIQNWERCVLKPTIRLIPRIIAFLGYDPEPEPQDLPRKIAYARRRLGLRQEDLVEGLRVSLISIWQWETGRATPPEAKLSQLQHKLDRAAAAGFSLL